MKFRNPETGEVFDDIEKARGRYCEHKYCKDDGNVPKKRLCPLPNKLTGYSDGCNNYCWRYPEEAASLMGYEVINDDAASALEGFAKALEKAAKPTRASILDEAKRCVCDWKEKDYGIYDNSFETVAELWRTYIEQGCVDDGVDVFLGPKDVAMLMALLQIAHVSCGTATDENFVNLAAYTAYCGEIVGGKK